MDTAASWLSEPNGGDQLAYALVGAACTAEVTTEQVYLALITPAVEPKELRPVLTEGTEGDGQAFSEPVTLSSFRSAKIEK